jgi:hypothetical protein
VRSGAQAHGHDVTTTSSKAYVDHKPNSRHGGEREMIDLSVSASCYSVMIPELPESSVGDGGIGALLVLAQHPHTRRVTHRARTLVDTPQHHQFCSNGGGGGRIPVEAMQFGRGDVSPSL